jgi:hypothetical protein
MEVLCDNDLLVSRNKYKYLGCMYNFTFDFDVQMLSQSKGLVYTVYTFPFLHYTNRYLHISCGYIHGSEIKRKSKRESKSKSRSQSHTLSTPHHLSNIMR